MALLVILLLIAAVIIVWFLMRDNQGNLPWEKYPESPLDILKKQYAEGKITKEEYEERKAVLEGDE